MLILKEFPTHVKLLVFQMLLVYFLINRLFPTEISAIIVVAQDGINTIGSMHLAQYIYKLIHLVRTLVHQIARKEYHIALLLVHQFHHLLDNAWTVFVTAGMDVGYLHDAIAVEAFRKARRGVADLLYLEMTKTKCAAIKGNAEEANGQDDAQPNEPSHGDGLDDGVQEATYQVNQHEDDLGHTYAEDEDAKPSYDALTL